MNSWVTCSRPRTQARLRLFCFPYAGGGASIFRAWPDDLPGMQVCPVQLPGRENRLREPCFIRLEPLVQALVQALPPYLDMPYAFFGHSLGALIGFELARALVRENRSGPVHLFVSGHSAPQVQSLEPPIHQLPEPDFIKELRCLNGTPGEVLQHAELMALLLPVLRADFAINETYVYTPGTLLDCPISAFGGLQDNLASRDDLAAWRDQTRSTFTLRMFPGDHFFLHSARPLLLRAIVHDLAQSLSRIKVSV
jgi:medium-chain acyl-[acyl-carrier-protein] hydrolase